MEYSRRGSLNSQSNHETDQHHNLASLLREPISASSRRHSEVSRAGPAEAVRRGKIDDEGAVMCRPVGASGCDVCGEGSVCWEEMAGIGCKLETKELWDRFYDLGTEMIITKSGR